MKLNAPKQITWLIALVLAVVGLVGELVTISVITDYSFWLMAIAAVLLLLATYFPGL
jgi:hypothetical protein